MKKLILTVFALCCMTIFTTAEANDCDAPSGFVCGSTLGTVFELRSCGFLGLFTCQIGHECCVDSVDANACNTSAVGCSVVTPE
jgi:hypothetical protein